MIAQKGQIWLAKSAPRYYDDLTSWELRHPGQGQHFLSANNIVHASNPCAGENAVPLRWVVMAALWDHGQAQSAKNYGRDIGWCGKCCVAFVAKEAAA